MKVAGRVLVVTGAGSGIGREVALEVLRRGGRVAAVDINPTTLAETEGLAAAGDRISTHVLNIADRDAVEALPDAVVDQHGSVDGIINCAGIIQPFVRLKDLDYETIDRVFGVNWFGTLFLTKTFLPVLLGRPEGHIVNVSSMGGFLPVPGQTIYGATKAAVKLMTEGLYAELLDTNVGVSVVMPGAVATDITANSGVDAPQAGGNGKAPTMTSADKAAEIILDGIEEGALHIYVGRDSRTMSIINRLAPRRSTHLIQRQMRGLLAS